jgi:hypothetical protein
MLMLLALPLLSITMVVAQNGKQAQQTVGHGSPYAGGDEGARDPSFQAFRQQFIGALHRHDVAFVRNILDPQIRLGFDGDDGLNGFDREWHIGDSTSEFWTLMSALVSRGASYDAKTRTFTAPYTFYRWPRGYDSEKTFIVFDAAKVYAEPTSSSKVIGTFSKEVVQYIEWVGNNTSPPELQWIKVRNVWLACGVPEEEWTVAISFPR